MKRRNFLKSILALPIFGRAIATGAASEALTAADLAGPGLASPTGCILDINYGCGLILTGCVVRPQFDEFGVLTDCDRIETVKVEIPYRTE